MPKLKEDFVSFLIQVIQLTCMDVDVTIVKMSKEMLLLKIIQIFIKQINVIKLIKNVLYKC